MLTQQNTKDFFHEVVPLRCIKHGLCLDNLELPAIKWLRTSSQYPNDLGPSTQSLVQTAGHRSPDVSSTRATESDITATTISLWSTCEPRSYPPCRELNAYTPNPLKSPTMSIGVGFLSQSGLPSPVRGRDDMTNDYTEKENLVADLHL